MPRQPRLDAPETLHHVMVRGSERRVLFRSLDRGPRPSGPPPRARRSAAQAAVRQRLLTRGHPET